MQTITGNVYKNFKYTFFTGTRILTVYDLFDVQLTLDSLALLTMQRSGAGNSMAVWAPSLNIINVGGIGYSVPQTAPTAGTATSGGSITAGTHSWVVTNIIGSSETLQSAKSNVLTIVGGTQTVPLTIPVGPPGTTARNIYRTNAGDVGTYYYIGQIADNTTTTFSDTTADNTTTAAPTTSTAFDISMVSGTPPTGVPTFLSTDTFVIEVRNLDQTYDYNLGAQKTIPQVMSELPPTDTQVGIITDTNLATGVYYYEIPASGWRNFVAQIKATCSTSQSIIDIFATLDPAAAVPATNGTPSVDWVNVTNAIFGIPLIYVPTSGTYVSPILNWNIDDNGMQVMYDRFLIRYQIQNATNFWNLNTKQF